MERQCISEEQRDYLLNHWLPRVHRLAEQRRPIRRLMVGVLITMCIVCLAAFIPPLVGIAEWNVSKHGITGMTTLMVFAIVFGYLGKLQSCDDQLLGFDLAVCQGEWECLMKTIDGLSCYSRHIEIIKDIQNLIGERENQDDG